MSTLQDLPPDQRAVLELVLARGRNYDQIAQLLAVDRAGVRQRALAALDALGPPTGVTPERRALITDYLLGQLPGRVSDDVREQLAESPADRAWARIVASELATVASAPLPEIPPASGQRHHPEHAGAASPNGDGGGARAAGPAPEPAWAADAGAATSPAAAADAGAATFPAAAADAGEATSPAAAADAGAATSPAAAADAGAAGPSARTARTLRRGSRKGGAFVLGIAALVIAVVLIVVFVIGGGKSKPKPAAHAATARPSTTATGTPAKPKVLGQIRLSPTSKFAKVQGIAEAFSESGQRLLAVVAINLPANKKNYYAVWLTNGGSASALVGYEKVAVTSNGRLQALGPLPSNSSRYTRLVLTLEPGTPPANGPTKPGAVVLSGPFNVK